MIKKKKFGVWDKSSEKFLEGDFALRDNGKIEQLTKFPDPENPNIMHTIAEDVEKYHDVEWRNLS